MKKKAVCLLFMLSILFCGCSKQKEDIKSYTFDIERSVPLLPNEKFKVYIQGNKWRQDFFEKNSENIYMSSLFDGKNLYTISYHPIDGLFGVRMYFDDFNDMVRNNNYAYPLLNWDVPNKALFSRSESEGDKKFVKKTKNKFGLECSLYEYPSVKYCDNLNCSITKRNVCVNDDNIALSISKSYELFKNGAKAGNTDFFSIDVIKIETEKIDDMVFKKPKKIYTEEGLEKAFKKKYGYDFYEGKKVK